MEYIDVTGSSREADLPLKTDNHKGIEADGKNCKYNKIL